MALEEVNNRSIESMQETQTVLFELDQKVEASRKDYMAVARAVANNVTRDDLKKVVRELKTMFSKNGGGNTVDDGGSKPPKKPGEPIDYSSVVPMVGTAVAAVAVFAASPLLAFGLTLMGSERIVKVFQDACRTPKTAAEKMLAQAHATVGKA